MKHSSTIFLNFITFLFLFSCSQITKTNENSASTTKDGLNIHYLIEQKSIEGFKVGAIFTPASSKFSYEKKLQEFSSDEGMYTMEVVTVNDQNEGLFDLVLNNNKIQKIIIRSEKCKTTNGISLYSNIQDFIKAYPDYIIAYSYISNSFWIQSNSSKNSRFFLNNNCYKGSMDGLYENDWTLLNSSDFDKDCSIKSIEIM